MTVDVSKLKELAVQCGEYDFVPDVDGGFSVLEIEYLNAVAPSEILSLLSRLESAEKALRVNEQFWKCAAEFDDPKYCSEYAEAADSATDAYFSSLELGEK